uniref:Phospholipase A2 group XIIB n=1 Tax=Gopherus evgoodei TaxID=1825980 RepID=A0A8C4WA27_9SAUR
DPQESSPATVVLCLALSLGRCDEEESSLADWGIGTIRDGFETINGYFDSFLELLGGKNGICQYRCRYGKTSD